MSVNSWRVLRDCIGFVRYGFFLSRRFQHDNKSTIGVFSGGGNITTNRDRCFSPEKKESREWISPCLDWCFFRRVAEGWIGVWGLKVWRLKIEVFGLKIER